MKKIVLFIILTIFWVVILFPKSILWDNFERVMEKKEISISSKEVDMQLYLLYNKVDIKNLTILKNFQVKELVVLYDILNPLYVRFYGNSEFGDFSGKIKIFEKKGFVILKSKNLKNSILKDFFKKSKDGMKYEFDY